MSDALRAELVGLVGDDHVVTEAEQLARYLTDATEAAGLSGRADAYVAPADADEVAAVVSWCAGEGIAVTPRGGGSGYAGGCVPAGGVVLGLERLTRGNAVDPESWTMHAGAGLTTRDVQRLARENGLYYPPDPGAPEQSQIGGNVATNAGGPHAFKYGTTGAQVTGLEVVLADGSVTRLGRGLRKDVAAYDLRGLLVGSEGTLGVITAVELRLLPAIPARHPVLAWYPTVAAGADAVAAAMACGTVPAALEYLDGATLAITRPPQLPPDAAIAIIAEADGTPDEAAAGRDALVEALRPGALGVEAPQDAAALWRWREGVGLVVDGHLGGKLSEDIAVPVTRLAEAITGTLDIGARHGLAACSWGHAGDGNLHSTFLFDRRDATQVTRALRAAEDLFAMAIGLGGSISGEHGLGRVKTALAAQLDPPAARLHAAVKELLDPRGVLNPGVKTT